MRIAVIGAGAVGGTFAALLDRAGHAVTVTARGSHLDTIAADGILLDGGWGTHRARVRAVPALDAPADLAILSTKAHDAAEALSLNLAAVEGGVPLLVVQNGLGGTDVARAALPHSPIVGGLALFAASYLSPGHVTVTAALPTLIGAGPGTSPAARDAVAAILAEAMPIEIIDDLRAAQWSKLLVNHVNALPAITGASVQETVADPRLLDILAANLQESLAVIEAVGVRLAPMAGFTGEQLHDFGRGTRAHAAGFFTRLAEGMGEVPNPASTLQSIRRGQLTEIDFLNGAVVRAGCEHGIPTPINSALVDLVHEVEATGRFLDVTAVQARVR